jgi:hypothetical protein
VVNQSYAIVEVDCTVRKSSIGSMKSWKEILVSLKHSELLIEHLH